MAHVSAKVADGRVLELVAAFLEQGVLSEQEVSEPEAGTPQGNEASRPPPKARESTAVGSK